MRYNEQVLSGQPVLASDSIRLMEARLNPLHLPIASSCCYSFPERPLLLPRRSITNSTPFPTSLPPYLIRASSSSSSSSSTSERVYRGPMPRRDLVADWVSNNDAAVRSFPIYAGVVSLAAVLINRTFSGIAPVADASSSQSRADILALALAVTNLLTGLVWLSIRPKYISPAVPCGVKCRWLYPGLPNFASLELLWSLVIVYGNICLLQIGIAAESSKNSGDAASVDVVKLIQGSLYQNVMKSAKQSYLANLSLYPGKSELPFFPANTQAVILQPIGDKGIAIIGGDTVRGFTSLDQAWISLIAEKMDATLSKFL